jgi:hypothetical protein
MYDVLLAPGIGRLNVEVSRETIPRSMLVWDRLLKSVEASGFKVRITKGYPAGRGATEKRSCPPSGRREESVRATRTTGVVVVADVFDSRVHPGCP